MAAEPLDVIILGPRDPAGLAKRRELAAAIRAELGHFPGLSVVLPEEVVPHGVNPVPAEASLIRTAHCVIAVFDPDWKAQGVIAEVAQFFQGDDGAKWKVIRPIDDPPASTHFTEFQREFVFEALADRTMEYETDWWVPCHHIRASVVKFVRARFLQLYRFR